MMTGRKQKALLGLLSQPTKAAAASYAGISGQTMRNYLADAEFRQAYRDALDDLLDDCTRHSQQQLHDALNVLAEVYSDPEAPPAVRVQAARGSIETALKLTDEYNTAARIEKIEAMLQEAADDET